MGDPWAPDESSVIRSKRRGRPKRRKVERRVWVWALRISAVVVVLGLVVGAVWWFNRPTGLAALPAQAIESPGGFRSTINSADTFTVGINLQNVASEPVTLVSARIITPAGLANTDLSILPVGPENAGFTLNGTLIPGGSVRLEPGDTAVVAARYKVDCQELLAAGQPTDEQIFVTIQAGVEQREEEIVVPVVGDVPWLTATGTRTCVDPVPTGKAEPPDPPDPSDGANPDTTPSPAG